MGNQPGIDTPNHTMTQYQDNTPISELTVGELRDLVMSCVRESVSNRRLVSGLEGLADLFGVSISTAKRIKKSGRINAAIAQSGRTFVVDADKAIRLWSGKKTF